MVHIDTMPHTKVADSVQYLAQEYIGICFEEAGIQTIFPSDDESNCSTTWARAARLFLNQDWNLLLQKPWCDRGAIMISRVESTVWCSVNRMGWVDSWWNKSWQQSTYDSSAYFVTWDGLSYFFFHRIYTCNSIQKDFCSASITPCVLKSCESVGYGSL